MKKLFNSVLDSFMKGFNSVGNTLAIKPGNEMSKSSLWKMLIGIFIVTEIVQWGAVVIAAKKGISLRNGEGDDHDKAIWFALVLSWTVAEAVQWAVIGMAAQQGMQLINKEAVANWLKAKLRISVTVKDVPKLKEGVC